MTVWYNHTTNKMGLFDGNATEKEYRLFFFEYIDPNDQSDPMFFNRFFKYKKNMIFNAWKTKYLKKSGWNYVGRYE